MENFNLKENFNAGLRTDAEPWWDWAQEILTVTLWLPQTKSSELFANVIILKKNIQVPKWACLKATGQ